jgi:serine/threonine-protein kinase HipA
MRKATVFWNNMPAGILAETEEGFEFYYLPEYLENSFRQAVSLTLPLQDQPFTGTAIFSFFDGLIPEGWLLETSTERLPPDLKNRIRIDGSNRHRVDNLPAYGDLLPQPIQRKSQYQTCSRVTLPDS